MHIRNLYMTIRTISNCFRFIESFYPAKARTHSETFSQPDGWSLVLFFTSSRIKPFEVCPMTPARRRHGGKHHKQEARQSQLTLRRCGSSWESRSQHYVEFISTLTSWQRATSQQDHVAILFLITRSLSGSTGQFTNRTTTVGATL